MTKMPELHRHCPFCASPDCDIVFDARMMAVRCKTCGGTGAWHRTAAKAWAAWDHRQTVDGPPYKVERKRKQVRFEVLRGGKG